MSRELRLRSAEDAARLIEHFNGFHDGFIRELRLRSRDRFTQEGPEPWQRGHECSGLFDAVLDVAHYNYGPTPRPVDRVVRGSFSNVSGFWLDLRGVRAMEWPIQNVSIEPARRQRDDGAEEDCFALTFLWSALEGERWTTRSGRLFLFEEAGFEERSAADL